jgi:hypothetical protein
MIRGNYLGFKLYHYPSPVESPQNGIAIINNGWFCNCLADFGGIGCA